MSDSTLELPTLVASSVVRGARQGDSHGGIYLLDFARQDIRQVVDWNTGEIDWQGRGWDRGLRGIAFFGGEVYVAASDELFVYDRNFEVKRSFRSSYLRHCHEIHVLNHHLYLTSTFNDSLLAFDLERQRFFWAIHMARSEDGYRGTPYDPNGLDGPGGAVGPRPHNQLHLNSVWADETGLYACGLRSGGLLRIGSDASVRLVAELPDGTHNARPFRDGVLFNDTAADRVRFAGRDGDAMAFAVPRYDDADLTRLDLGDEQVARQGFGRGLCALDQRFVAAGSSPSTVSILDLESGAMVMRVNFSTDVRNAVHGLEVWPF